MEVATWIKTKERKGLLWTAEDYAIHYHTLRSNPDVNTFGGAVETHLREVALLVSTHSANPDDQAIAWLHDVLEDTEATFEELDAIFGIHIASRVLAVTDGPGKNRYDRQLQTYYRTRQFGSSVLVKLCDRQHNHQRSLDQDHFDYMRMYAGEFRYFQMALYYPGQWDALWLTLNAQILVMHAKLRFQTETELLK